jgi:hypothetical protein
VFVHLVAFAAQTLAEVFAKTPVGFDDPQVAILDGDVTRDFFEEELVAFLALSQLLLQELELGNVRGHLHHVGDLTGVVQDRCRVYDDVDFSSVESPNDFLATVTFAVSKRPFHRAFFALLGPVLVNLVTVTTFVVSEIVSEAAVGLDDAKIAVLDREVAGHGLETLLVRKIHPLPPSQ